MIQIVRTSNEYPWPRGQQTVERGRQAMDAGQPTSSADDAGKDELKKDPVPLQSTNMLDSQAGGMAGDALPPAKRRRAYGSKSASDGSPRRPVPAFILFSAEKRREIQEKEPGLKFPEVTKKLSGLWNSYSKAEKEPYQRASQESKDRYTQELRAFGRKKSQERGSITSPSKHYCGKDSSLSKELVAMATDNKHTAKPERKRGRPPKDLQPRVNVAEEPTLSVAATSISVMPVAKSLSQRGMLPSVLAPDTDIPVFTDQFLQYNKDLDRDLWQIRRTNKMTQEENELLQQSVEELQASVDQLQERIRKTTEKNNKAERRLEQIKSIIATVFSDSYLPEKLTKSTVEEFLKKLAGNEDPQIKAAVRNVKHEIAKFVHR